MGHETSERKPPNSESIKGLAVPPRAPNILFYWYYRYFLYMSEEKSLHVSSIGLKILQLNLILAVPVSFFPQLWFLPLT